MAATLLAQLQARGVHATRLALDSRKVEPGDVFLALPGAHADGRRFIAEAIARGAAAVIHERGCVDAVLPAPTIAVENLAVHAGEIAHLVYGRPSEQVWMAGVTGTNGKTSVSHWIAQAMGSLACQCGVIGTLGNGFLPELDASPNTTPDAVALHAALARFVRAGAVACAMEVSSIGLDQGRVNGIRFDVGVFTNLTRDHLEYHGDIDAYGAAKALLFDRAECAVLNLDDPFGARRAAELRGRCRTIGYTLGAATGADIVLRATDLSESGAGLAFMLDGQRYAAPVVGRFNAANLLAVIGALLANDKTPADIAAALCSIIPPAGRMQSLGGEHAPLVVIDYAHTPDALEKVLATLRVTAQTRGGRLTCVFGCGGDRDPGKRPQMGALAERGADTVVLTSDNPRSEDALAIIGQIRAGMASSPAIEPDRAAAIRAAVGAAAPADVILIAGKGHESYQEIAGVRLPFSDLAAAKSALQGRQPC